MKNEKRLKRLKRARKTRSRLKDKNAVRLVVNKTSQHIYAQVIEPGVSDKVVASASTLEKEFKSDNKAHCGNIQAATEIGKLIATRAKEKGCSKLAFDRSGNKYHGRVKALADAAREAGLEF